MNETTILQRIRLAVTSIPGLKLFRNNVGGLKDQQGRFVQFGLHPGSADLIGWRTITITPEMVGQRVAVFASVEVKTDSGRVKPEQQNWLEQVTHAGGLAVVARSPEEARKFFFGNVKNELASLQG
jgi:hypothetical protein